MKAPFCSAAVIVAVTTVTPLHAGLIAHYTFADGDLFDNEVGASYTLSQVQSEGDGDAGTSAEVTIGNIDGIRTAVFPGGRNNSADIAWLETAAGISPADFTVSFWFRLNSADGQVPDQDESFQGLFTSDSGNSQQSNDWQIDSRGSNSGELGFICGVNSPNLVSNFIATQETWYHVAVRKDNDAANPLQIHVTALGTGGVGVPLLENPVNTMGFDKFALGVNRGANQSYGMHMANVKIYDDSEVLLDDLFAEGPGAGDVVVVRPAVVTASSGSDWGNLVNNSGLNANMETGDVVPGLWPKHVWAYMSGGTIVDRPSDIGGRDNASGLPITLDIDLGGTFHLEQVAIWNYAEYWDQYHTDRGSQTLEISLSNDGGFTFGAAQAVTLTRQPDAYDPLGFGPDVFALTGAPVEADTARLRITSNHGGSFAGLFEVRFTGAVVASNGTPPQPEEFRTWLGPEYWANRLQDWRRVEDRLDCIMDGKDRSVHHLTWQLDPTSSLTTRVAVMKVKSSFGGYAGFRFAKHGALLDEYRHNCINGSGIDAGIKADGSLFIDDQTTASAWPDGELRILELTLTPGGAQHTALLRLLDGSDTEIAQVTKLIDSADIHGNLALVCHASSNGAHGSTVVSFEDWTVSGTNLRGGPGQNWGPILWCQYTLSRSVLKLAAQFAPIGVNDEHTAALDLWQGGAWVEVATAEVDDLARIALFRVDPWTATGDVNYRVRHVLDGIESTYEGTIRRDPVDEAELSVAGFTGNKDYGFPNHEIVSRVGALDPDVLFFSGDQIYEDVARFGVQRSPLELASLDYLRKWYLVGWSFGDLIRNRPAVFLPDDHDVYQGNVWGSGGDPVSGQQDGGYTMNADWVNVVQRTQTSHFPDPHDPTPILQNISVYYAPMVYGRVSFAIIEDRKFKNGPNEVEPTGSIPVAEAELLGDRQHAFLRDWAQDWRGCDLKAVLSQTAFAQCHTHGGNENNPINQDKDANGWPPPARDEALREIRKGFAMMFAGDNHLPTIAHHGIDDWEDAGVSFTVPSIAAGFPRKWEPSDDPDKTVTPGGPVYALDNLNRIDNPEYLGRYTSDHGHRLTMVAAANPERWGGSTAGDIEMLSRKSSGFGLVRFNKVSRDITIECWRIEGDLADPEAGQYPDWPVTIRQTDNYGRQPTGVLPVIENTGLADAVVQVVDEGSGEVVYTLRSSGSRFRPHVFGAGPYTVRYGEPETDTWTELTGQAPSALPATLDLRAFAAECPYVIQGDSVRLEWDTPGATGVTLTGVGDVTRMTFNGVGTTTVAPTADTVYTLTADGPGGPLQAQVEVKVFETLAQWKARQFTPGELLDPNISGDDADPDNDGISNLVEYTMTTDPWADSRGDLPELHIVPGIGGESGERFLSIAARGLLKVAGVEYEVEYSPDLSQWGPATDLDLEEVQVIPGGAGETGVHVSRDKNPVDHRGGPRGFWRLTLSDAE